MAIFEETDDRAGIGGSYHQLGMLAEVRGDYDNAEDHYQVALAIKAEIGDRPASCEPSWTTTPPTSCSSPG